MNWTQRKETGLWKNWRPNFKAKTLAFEKFFFNIAHHGVDARMGRRIFQNLTDISQCHGCTTARDLRFGDSFTGFRFDFVRINFLGHDLKTVGE